MSIMCRFYDMPNHPVAMEKKEKDHKKRKLITRKKNEV